MEALTLQLLRARRNRDNSRCSAEQAKSVACNRHTAISCWPGPLSARVPWRDYALITMWVCRSRCAAQAPMTQRGRVPSRSQIEGSDVCASEHTGFYLEPYVRVGDIICLGTQASGRCPVSRRNRRADLAGSVCDPMARASLIGLAL